MQKGKMEEIRWVREIGLYKKISRAEAKRSSNCAYQVCCDRQGSADLLEESCERRRREPCSRTNSSVRRPRGRASKCCWDSLLAMVCPAQKGESLKWLSSISVELISWRPWIVKRASNFRRKTNCQKTVTQLVYFCGRCTGSEKQVQIG